MKTDLIGGKVCYLYDHRFQQNSPIIYIGLQDDSKKLAIEIEKILEKNTKDEHYLLVFYETTNWDADFSPWKAEINYGKRIFAGKGKHTLQWLLQCVNEIQVRYCCSSAPNNCFITGYSLAGLFSLWALYESKLFRGAASCSGSLWYPGWKEYILKKLPPCHSLIYLSLGRKEEQTKNSMMAQVGDVTRIQYKQLQKDLSILEWHNGGHFHQVEWRIARAIEWLIVNGNNDNWKI